MSNEFLIGIEWEPQFTLLNYPNHSVYFKNTTRRKSSIIVENNAGGIYANETSNLRVVVDLASTFDVWQATRVAANNADKSSAYKYTSTDGKNLELITRPVTPDKLQSEIEKVETKLRVLCEQLVGTTGPLGVFLPAWDPGFGQPSKHINISSKEGIVLRKGQMKSLSTKIAELNATGFFSSICLKSECRKHRQRIHVTVPYNFTDYNRLLKFFSNNIAHEAKIITYIYEWSVVNPMPYMWKTQKQGIFLGYIHKKRYNRVEGLL